MNKLLKTGIINSLGVAVYIVGVALLMQYGDAIFANSNTLAIIGVLALMTLSVAIVGSLIFLKPVMMYLDGAKKEALKLLMYTIGSLAVMLVVYLIIIAII